MTQPVGVQLEPLGSDRKISEKSSMQLPDFMTVFLLGLFYIAFMSGMTREDG